MEPQNTYVYGKRMLPGGWIIEEESGDKKYYVDFPDRGTVKLSKSKLSPLITSYSHTRDFDESRFFRRKIFRLPHRDQTVELPELSDEEIRDKIPWLMNHYRKNEDDHQPKAQPIPQMTQKEIKLAQAASLVMCGSHSLSSAAKLTGLKKSLVSSMISRLSNSGNLLPFKCRKKRNCFRYT